MSGTSPTGSSTARKDRRIGPALIAFIVLDVLLVAWAIGLGVSLGSDDTEGSTTAEPSASASAPPAPAPTSDVDPEEGAEEVASPSGNITCRVSPSGAECGIASLAADPAPVDGCDGAVGYVVELTSDGVSVPCVSDDERPRKADPTIAVLEYGENVTVNNFSCDSTEAGMMCTDTSTDKGFTLARAGITEF